MELAYYAEYAVRLVNTEEPLRGTDALTSVEAVRELCGPGTHAAGHQSGTFPPNIPGMTIPGGFSQSSC